MGMGAGAGAGGAAAVGGGLGGTLGMITGNPLLAALLAQAGSRMFSSFFGGASPYEQAAGQMLGAQRELIPQLQRQAAGLPTIATENIKRQLRQEGTRQGQAFAASAQRQGIAGMAPATAQQGRIAAATTEAIGNQLAQAQLAAQQQLLGVGAQGMQAQGLIEQRQQATQQQFMSDIGAFMGWYQQNQYDPLAMEMMDALRQLFGYQTKFMSRMTQGLPANPPYRVYPMRSTLNPPARQTSYRPPVVRPAFRPGGEF